MRLGLKQGQSMLEYTVLLCIIVSSLLIMQFYVKRSYSGRIKEEANQIGLQYAPGHTNSWIQTKTLMNTTTYTGGETDEGQNVPIGMTLTDSQTNVTFVKKEAVDSFAVGD